MLIPFGTMVSLSFPFDNCLSQVHTIFIPGESLVTFHCTLEYLHTKLFLPGKLTSTKSPS